MVPLDRKLASPRAKLLSLRSSACTSGANKDAIYKGRRSQRMLMINAFSRCTGESLQWEISQSSCSLISFSKPISSHNWLMSCAGSGDRYGFGRCRHRASHLFKSCMNLSIEKRKTPPEQDNLHFLHAKCRQKGRILC